MALTEKQIRNVVIALNNVGAFKMPNGESVSVFKPEDLEAFYGKHEEKVLEVISKIDHGEFNIPDIEAYRDEVLLPALPKDVKIAREEALSRESGKHKKADNLLRQSSATDAKEAALAAAETASKKLKQASALKKEARAELWNQRFKIAQESLTIVNTMIDEMMRKFAKGVSNDIATTLATFQVGFHKLQDDCKKIVTRGFEDLSDVTMKTFEDFSRSASAMFKSFRDFVHDSKENFLDATTNRQLYRRIEMLQEGLVQSIAGNDKEALAALQKDKLALEALMKDREDDKFAREKVQKDADIARSSDKVTKSLARKNQDATDKEAYEAEYKATLKSVSDTLRGLGAKPGGDNKNTPATDQVKGQGLIK